MNGIFDDLHDCSSSFSLRLGAGANHLTGVKNQVNGRHKIFELAKRFPISSIDHPLVNVMKEIIAEAESKAHSETTIAQPRIPQAGEGRVFLKPESQAKGRPDAQFTMDGIPGYPSDTQFRGGVKSVSQVL
jgi:hypothetical protein